MLHLRALTLLAVVGLFASTGDAPAKEKNKEHSFHGTVVHVHHDKDKKHHGTITVKHHHKGDSVTKTFTINEDTHIHTGGKSKSGPAKLHKGLHVTVHFHDHHADAIKLEHGKKK